MNNKIKIFEQEIKDGISSSIESQASIAYCSLANHAEKLVLDVSDDVKKTIASANKDQFDLYYLKSVLVSTGWNKNDDVFLPDLTWVAKSTPEDKQFNLMHDENTIIGHITGSYVIDHSGNIIASDSENIPENFDIITEAVIYKNWQDQDNQERIDKIIAEIDQDKWFVSMECLFSNFHYAVISPDGEQHLLERNEASAYLSKHLRAYGGEGKYEGYKIGRALSNISFSGKGLVSTPANARSIILRSEASFNVKANEFTKDLTIGENQMDELKEQIEQLKAQLASAKDEAEAVKKEAKEKQEKEMASLIKEKDEAIAQLNTKIEAALQEVTNLKTSVANKEKELSTANEAVAKMESDKKKAERKDKMVKAGLSEEEAESSVALYEPLADEAFAKVVEQLAAAYKGKEEKDKKDKEKEDKDKTEANAETFSDTKDKAEATFNQGDEDKSDKLRQSIASWIGGIYNLESEKGDK